MRDKTARPGDLKVGDRIRIIGMPGVGVPDYYLHRDTRRTFRMLVARRRPVRIAWIDEFGSPWYTCRFRTKGGACERHDLAVCDLDNNWVLVKPHRKKQERTRA
jgi:hypothetical protein